MSSILSLNERLSIYQQTLEKYVTDNCMVGICHKLRFVGIKLTGKKEISRKTDFPEFSKQKPWFKSKNDYWWKFNKKGTQKRIKALQKAIQLVHKQIKENDKH